MHSLVSDPTSSGGGDFDLILYDSSNNILQQKSFAGKEIWAGSTASQNRHFLFSGNTLSELTPGSTYRIAIKATHATGILRWSGNSLPLNTDITAYIPEGEFKRTSRTDTGSWTNVDNAVWGWHLLLSEATATSGGGLMVHPGMSGGMRG